MLTIAPGVYRIRNVSTNQYLTPQGGYPSPGRQVVFEDFSQDGAQKVKNRAKSRFLRIIG